MNKNGFHLTEMLIVLVIIAITASFGIPMYTHHLAESRRLEAETTLSKLAVALENYYLEHQSYTGASLAELHIPEKIAKNNYELKIAYATEQDFLLTAKPLGKQADRDNACGNISLRADGERYISGWGRTNDCW